MLDYLGEVQRADVARAEAKLERPARRPGTASAARPHRGSFDHTRGSNPGLSPLTVIGSTALHLLAAPTQLHLAVASVAPQSDG